MLHLIKIKSNRRIECTSETELIKLNKSHWFLVRK